MNDYDLAAKLPQDYFSATAALIALTLGNLPTQLVLVPTDGSEPLWLARTPAYFR